MKVKHTIYLPQSTIELLDGIWLEMRAAFKSRAVTKSLLIELAIDAAAKELTEHGKESKIYELMSEQLAGDKSDGC